jgi:hypothetical protein
VTSWPQLELLKKSLAGCILFFFPYNITLNQKKEAIMLKKLTKKESKKKKRELAERSAANWCPAACDEACGSSETYYGNFLPLRRIY